LSFKKTQKNLKRKIEPQTRFMQKKKKKLETTTMSSAEKLIIKKSLKYGTDEVINISKSKFDHSYI
jgi:hypothetical protein